MSAVEQTLAKSDPVVARLRGVAKQYQRGNEVVPVLEKLDLDLPRGDFVALMGPSGSGKTTLLNLLGGLDRPTTGSVEVDGLAIDRMSDAALAAWRGDTRRLRVPDVQPAAGAHRGAQRRAAAAADARSVARSVSSTCTPRWRSSGLGDRMKHKPRELSGGQEQRVGIARAIVTDPTLLLCDEPTGDLDRKSGDEILDLLQALNKQHGKTIVMVTHDPRAAERANRTLHLEKGRLERETS